MGSKNRLRYYRNNLESIQWALVNLREVRSMGGSRFIDYGESRRGLLNSALQWRYMILALMNGTTWERRDG